MGDHFVLLVDRLLTESTLGAAIESQNLLLKQAAPQTVDEAIIDCSPHKNLVSDLSQGKMEECRICQDEDMDLNMESPCSCSGTLKYAHRKCVQKWCNEKGDTICEICHQQFNPGYTAPPPMFRFGGLPANLRGNWQIAGRNLYNNHRIIAMVSSDRGLLDPDYEEHDLSASRSIVCCRSAAIIFMVLLILRHTLPVIVSRGWDYSFPLIMLLMLRIAGIIAPICIILKVLTSILHRRQQGRLLASVSDEESSVVTLNPPLVSSVH